MPATPPPIAVQRHFGLNPPSYPPEERKRRLHGEVLLAVRIDEKQHLVEWRVARSTTKGFAQSVLMTMSKKGVAKGVAAGIYCYSVVFMADDNDASIDQSRAGTLWVGTR